MEIRNLGERPEDLGHLLRQLAHPRLAGRGGRRPRVRAPGARRGHHDLRHRRRLRQHQGRERARQGAGGRAARGARDLHQGLLADRPGRAQRPRAVAQAHHGVDRRLAAPARHRLRRPLPGAPLRPRDAARGDDGGLRRRRPLRQGALHRRLGVAGRGDPRAATRSPASCASRWSRTSRSTTCSGGSSRPRWCPTCEELGIGQIVWSPIAQGALTGKYKPGEQPPGGLARHRRQGRRRHDQPLDAGRRARAGAAARSRSPTRPA